MKKDAKVFVQYILECMGLIAEYLENKSKDEFLNSRQLQDSVIRRIEIIGEAVKNIPQETHGWNERYSYFCIDTK